MGGWPPTRDGSRAHPRVAAVVAAVLYLALALWAVRVVLPAPASTFAYPLRLDPIWRPVVQSDQKLTAALVSWNAWRWSTRPWRLFDNGQCYPAPNPATLGEHMFGDGLLGVLPYVLTRDPILVYNVVVVLVLWLPALAMYALAAFWTGSTAAALVAGLLFGFHPGRVGDLVHPYVRGNHWTPLALLFAHRLVTRGRWSDAALLASFVGLQALESFYPLLAFALLGGTYGVYLVVRNVARLTSLAPRLLAVAAVTMGFVAVILGPYLHTRALWDTLGGRSPLLYAFGDFGPRGAAYPGTLMVVLAGIGLADRLLRGPRLRHGYDPRIVFLAAGLLVVWAAVWDVPLPFTSVRIPSLFVLSAKLLPGLDAIRGGAAIGFGVVVVTAFLAAYGVLSLEEALTRWRVARRLAVSLLVVGACAEVFVPALAKGSFGGSVEMDAYRVRPPSGLLALYRTTQNGAVLDVPFGFSPGRFFEMADDVLSSAFHHRPVAACYNSFKLPIQDEIQAMAERLPRDHRVAEALHALGFRSVVVDELRAMKRPEPGFPRLANDPPRIVEIGRAALHTAYSVQSTTPVIASFTALAIAPGDAGEADNGASGTAAGNARGGTKGMARAAGGEVDAARSEAEPDSAPLDAVMPQATLELRVRNGAAATYRHPMPFAPTALIVRWSAAAGNVYEYRTAALLPLALAAGEESVRPFTVMVPPAAGEYELRLAPAATPELVLAKRRVLVLETGPPGAPARASRRSREGRS